MTAHLTTVNTDLDRLVKRTPAGMMHWAGTGPAETTCGQCQHYGYLIDVINFSGTVLAPRKYPNRCRLYFQYTQRHGGKLPPATPACKYFQRKNGGMTDD